MYLLDNNVISEIRKIKAGRANKGLEQWIKDKSVADLFTCEIVIMEIVRGIELKRRKDIAQADHLQAWFDNFVLPSFQDRVLTIDRKVSLVCASFHVPNPRPENDTWIASIAKANNLTLVTRNLKDFEGLPIKMLNPFI